jgi:hypothetical protein
MECVGIAETEWKIPKEAKLGVYEVTLLAKKTKTEGVALPWRI